MSSSSPPGSVQIQNERAVVRAFEDAGAVSPATARPLAEITAVDATAVLPLATRRVVREAAPGRYYLHAGGEHARRRVIVRIVFCLVLLLVPVLLIQFAGH